MFMITGHSYMIDMSLTCVLVCTAFLLCFVLARDGVQAVDVQASIPGTVAGTYYSAVQTDMGVTVFSSVVIPSGMDYYVNATFANGHFPYQCGERLSRCNVTIVRESPGPKVAAVASLDLGVGLALFNVSTNHTALVDQYVISLSDFEPTLSCNFTSFVDTVDTIHTDDTGATLYGFCYNFLSMSNSDEVEMWIFTVVVNFNQLNDSRLVLLYRDKSPYGLSSTELSHPFFFGSDVCSSPSARVMWHDDGFLYIWRTDTGTFFSFDTEQPLCHADNVSQPQVELFRGNQLLAYCSNNTVVEIDVCMAGGFTVPSLAYYPTRFYCSRVDNSTYVEQQGDNLILVSPSHPDTTLPLPWNTSVRYVVDCVEVNNELFFVRSSSSGTVVYVEVLKSTVITLTESASFNHEIYGDRFLIYSNTTSSVFLDLSCPSPSTPIHVHSEPFSLSTFEVYENFSCLTVQPLPPSNYLATVLGASLSGVVALIVVISLCGCLVIILFYRYCYNKQPNDSRHITQEEGYGNDRTVSVSLSPLTNVGGAVATLCAPNPQERDHNGVTTKPSYQDGLPNPQELDHNGATTKPSYQDGLPTLDCVDLRQPPNNDKNRSEVASISNENDQQTSHTVEPTGNNDDEARNVLIAHPNTFDVNAVAITESR